MFKPQDIEDLIEHSAQKQGVHSMTTVPTPGGVPVAKEDGFIDDGWLSSQILRKGEGGKISLDDLPDGLALTVNGAIPQTILPDPLKATAFQSSGTSAATRFYLSDGTDLAAWILNKVGAGGIEKIEDYVLPNNNCSATRAENNCTFDSGFTVSNCSGTPQVLRHVEVVFSTGNLFGWPFVHFYRHYMTAPTIPISNCYSS
jgi:hypothetical protein